MECSVCGQETSSDFWLCAECDGEYPLMGCSDEDVS